MKRLLFILLLVPSLLYSADLSYLVDMRTALMDQLGISAPTNFYTSAKLNRFINRGIKFVEESTQGNQEKVAYVISAGVFRYALPDTLSESGVASVFVIPQKGENTGQPRGLSYKEIPEFSKTPLKQTEIYSLWDRTLFLSPAPVGGDSLYVLGYRVSYDLTSDSALVRLARGWKREFAVEYAYLLCLKAEKNFTQYNAEWQLFLTRWQMITGVQLKQPERLSPENP